MTDILSHVHIYVGAPYSLQRSVSVSFIFYFYTEDSDISIRNEFWPSHTVIM